MSAIEKITRNIQNSAAQISKKVTNNINCAANPPESDKISAADIPASVHKAYSTVKDSIIRKFNFVTKSGETKEATAKFLKQGTYENVTISVGGKTVCSGQINPDYLSSLLDTGTSYNEKMKDFGNCIYILFMKSSQPGGGTLFHKAVVERSKELGYGGRVALEAAWSSHPFHLKSGFKPLFDDMYSKFILEKINEQMTMSPEKRINTDWVTKLDMILTEKNAENLLNKPV